MVTRPELTSRITQTKKDISAKRSQIKGVKKRARFKGVTIKRQFEVGKQGVKPFRKRRKKERRFELGQVNLVGTDLINLNSTLSVREQDLLDFDLLPIGEP